MDPLERFADAPLLVGLGSWLDAHRILPNAFIQGFVYSQVSAQQMPAFLAGNISADGWWYYFPIAFLIKTPSALILLFIVGLVVYVKRRRELQVANELFVLMPVSIYLGVAMTSGINLGLRHILPIYPFVLLIATAAAKELMTGLIGSLQPGDTFNVVLFAGSAAVLAPAPVAATPENLARAIVLIDRHQAGGGTELLRVWSPGGEVTQITKGPRRLNGITFDKQFTRIAYTAGVHDAPADVYVARIDGSDERKLTNVHRAILAAIGAIGGYVCGSRDLIEFLYHRGRPFLFSSAVILIVTAALNYFLDLLAAQLAYIRSTYLGKQS